MRDRLRMQAGIRKRPVKWVSAELVVLARFWVALRGNGPALAGNLGTGWAFALSREGDQGVDVPMLAPTRSRCRFVEWGYVPLWGGLIVAVEEKQSSFNRCFGDGVEAQEGSGKDGAFALCARDFGDRLQCSLRPDPAAAWRIWGCSVVPVLRRKALGRWGVRSAPTGHRILARGETPGYGAQPEHSEGTPHTPGRSHTCFAVAKCRGWRLGLVGGGGSAGSVLRSQGSSREHGLSRCARGMSVIASNARSGPIPLPPETIRLSLGVWRDLGGGPSGGAWATKNLEPRATGRGWLKHDLIHR